LIQATAVVERSPPTVEALARGEQVTYRDHDGDLLTARTLDDVRGELGYCDYIDLSISWVDDADSPKSWTCPECGGTDFEAVHRDYGQAGLKGTSFTVNTDDE
jgi:hypothetical protein